MRVSNTHRMFYCREDYPLRQRIMESFGEFHGKNKKAGGF